MSDIRVKQHPRIGILVGTDGHVLVPGTKNVPAHWTYGTKHRNGYLTINTDGKSYLVHRLVLETFVGECPEGCVCDHISRNRDDNRLENLRWVTIKENQHNTSANDRCFNRIGINYFTDFKEARRRNSKSWYENKKLSDEFKNKKASYQKTWETEHKKTHTYMVLSDRKAWVPKDIAAGLLKLPVKDRKYDCR